MTAALAGAPAHEVPTGNTFDKYGSRNPAVRLLMARFERTLGRHESIAGRMRLQAADVQIHLLGQTEAVPSNADEIA